MGHRLTARPVPGDWNGMINALMRLDHALNTSSSPTFESLVLSGLTPNAVLYSDDAGILTSLSAAANGELVIGSTGTAPVVTTLTGTAKRVTVLNEAGSITLSGPQDLDTVDSPTFADLTLDSPSNIYALSHDSFADFVESEHVDHALTLDDALVVWLRMDDLDGSDPVDLGRLGKTWTAQGSAAQTDDGIIGKAWNFTAPGDNIIANNTTDLPLGTDSRTVCLWVKASVVSTSGLVAYGKQAAGTGWEMVILSSGKLFLGVGAGASTGTSDVLLDGKWHHVAITYDFSDGTGSVGDAKFYVDGELDVNSASATVLNTDGGTLQVGSSFGIALPLTGDIDDVRIYSRALADTEILELFELGTLNAMTAFDTAYFAEYIAARSIYAGIKLYAPIVESTTITASGTITGGQLTSTGDIDAVGEITGEQITSTDDMTMFGHLLTIGADNSGSSPVILFVHEDQDLRMAWEGEEGVLDINGGVHISGGSSLNVTGQLDVTSSLTVGGNFTVDTTTLVVDAVTHRVGIGTADPGSKLTVFTDAWNTAETPLVNITNLDPNAVDADALLVRGGANNEASDIFKVQDYNGNTDFVVVGNGKVGIGEPSPEVRLEITYAAPYLTLHNDTHENSDGGRESRINFKGEQDGTEETTLARIEVSHDGTGDDEKGKFVISVNDGDDGDTPTDRFKIDAAGVTRIGAPGTTDFTTEADGNSYWVGAGTGLPYGSLYMHEATQTVDLVENTYVKITGFTTGLMNNVSIVSDAFRPGVVGVYKIDWQISGDAAMGNEDMEIAIFFNGGEVADGNSRFHVPVTAGNEFSVSGSAIVDITSTGQDIDLRIKNLTSSNDVDLFHANFNLVQIGGT